MNGNDKHQQECSTQTESFNCISCREKTDQLSSQTERLYEYESEKTHLSKLISCDDINSEVDVIESVANIVKEASIVRGEVEQLREDGLRMAESVGRQLSERDNAHSECRESQVYRDCDGTEGETAYPVF